MLALPLPMGLAVILIWISTHGLREGRSRGQRFRLDTRCRHFGFVSALGVDVRTPQPLLEPMRRRRICVGPPQEEFNPFRVPHAPTVGLATPAIQSRRPGPIDWFHPAMTTSEALGTIEHADGGMSGHPFNGVRGGQECEARLCTPTCCARATPSRPRADARSLRMGGENSLKLGPFGGGQHHGVAHLRHAYQL